jgi:hypothetical protein
MVDGYAGRVVAAMKNAHASRNTSVPELPCQPVGKLASAGAVRTAAEPELSISIACAPAFPLQARSCHSRPRLVGQLRLREEALGDCRHQLASLGFPSVPPAGRPHRATAAARALSLRASGVSRAAAAFPPALAPSAANVLPALLALLFRGIWCHASPCAHGSQAANFTVRFRPH